MMGNTYASNNNKSIESIFSLENKTCLLTGATGHLGVSMAFALSSAGGFVYLAGRNKDKLDKLCVAISAIGGRVKGLNFDLLNFGEIKEALAIIKQERGGLDVLVNNAYSGKTGSFSSIGANDFMSAYSSGLCSTVNLVNEALPLLKARAKKNAMSSIINVASMYGVVSPNPKIYGKTGHDNPPSYGAMKAAVIQYTKYAATNLAVENIRVNSISPGAFPSSSVADKMPGLWESLSTMQPLERIGNPDELQGPIIFLASNASSYVTGHNLVVDGGWTIW
jgi:NAD(P)-dependent dehydrogenase (short-subunit alcohol dehydrogenase family)